MSGYRLASGYKLLSVISLALMLGALPIFLLDKPAASLGTLPPGFVQATFAGGGPDPLDNPTAMDFAPDGRLFVAEQTGSMQVVNTDGTLQDTPFLNLPANKINAAGERGLLGVAFDPDFDPTFDTTDDNYVYVYYTSTQGGIHNRVSRFPAAEDGNGNLVAGTEDVVFELPPLSATNHNGGAIHFGTDGKLYVAVGENARPSSAQSLSTTLGKMLRINKDGSIPTDNPFIAYTTGQNQAIWAAGLRNPYSFDVQPGTGRIFINDVGQQTYEEINEGKAGANYGWPVNEGPVRYQVPKKKKKGTHKKKRRHRRPAAPFYSGPLFYYPHSAGCAITGGAFYNPRTGQFPPDYVGDYFFADFCEGWISKYDPDTGQVSPFKSGSGELPVDLKVSKQGELFVLARNPGSVEKISYLPPAATP